MIRLLGCFVCKHAREEIKLVRTLEGILRIKARYIGVSLDRTEEAWVEAREQMD